MGDDMRITRRDFSKMVMGTVAAGSSPVLFGASNPYVANFADADTYLRQKFRQDVTDRTTGFDNAGIKDELRKIIAEGAKSGEPWRMTKAKCFAFELTRQAIDVAGFDWFPAISLWNRNDLPMRNTVFYPRSGPVNAKRLPKQVQAAWHAGNNAGDWCMWQDFDHSVPDWRVILKLGFPGVKARLEKYAKPNDPFYDSVKVVMDAIMAGIDRFIVQAKKRLAADKIEDGAKGRERLTKEIACLERLRREPPQTAYDMLMFVWLWFFDSEHLDAFQCRSLSLLDVFLTPYYDADIAAGRTTEVEFREQLKHFLWQWGSVNNYWNQPAGLGGTNPDGSSAFNHVSKIIMEVVDECNLPTPKILVKIAPNTPDWAMDKLMDMARRHRSLAFIGEESAAKSLKKWDHASDEDCRTMDLFGCYGHGLPDALNRTGAGHVNFLKPVEKMLAEAKDGTWSADSFDAFVAEYLRRLGDVSERGRKIAAELQTVLGEVNPANMMTLATEHALKTRRDGFMDGCPRGNASSFLGIGTGTTVDALMAVKELVYEKREMTLAELGAVMAANWKGHEPMRLRMLRSKRKWGNNDKEANALGAEILKCFASRVNGFPNGRGGTFRASGHSARQFIELGKKTGATPDGRKAGEEMSKNLSPTMGADTEGVTALVATLASSSVEVMPGNYPLDVMMHPSACAGREGLEAMKSVVRVFHANGGDVVQFMVFSSEELRDAQAHPEKYANLQVRVCGWNVRWNDMPKSEQDAYILRAERIMH